MLQQTSDTAVQWRFVAGSQTAPGLQDIRHNAQKYTNLYWFHAGSIIVHNDVLCLDWLMQKQELNTKARKTNPKQKMKHPRCQVFESASEAMQVFAKLPIVRNRNCLKNALKCRCEPEPPITNFGPWSKSQTCNWKPGILRIQSRALDCKPALQSRTSGCNQGLLTHCSTENTIFHCKPKPLVATPLLQEFEARGFLMFLLLPTTKKLHHKPKSSIATQNKIFKCNPKSLNATQNP